MDLKIHSQIKLFITMAAFMFSACTVEAGSANWRPTTIPYSEADVASFRLSNITNVVLGDAPNGTDATNIVGGMVFEQGASAYTVTLSSTTKTYYPTILEFHGVGLTNRAGITQKFIATRSDTKNSGRFYFLNSASADRSTFTAGRNNYQVNYSGGDGNDLTLIVVP